MSVIAVDFDGCLCENDFPRIGRAKRDVIEALVRRQADGDRVILWTCRSGVMLDDAVLWCLNRGLKFDAVNDNLPENVERYHNNCRKVWADEYWDDHAICVGGQSDICAWKRTQTAARDGWRERLARWWKR